MRILRHVSELTWPTDKVGFVPTMGAFHDGHLSLMRTAKNDCGYCVASLFVNPTQFGPNEDFAKYPRNEERDFELAESAGVDAIFAPDREEVYRDSETMVKVSGVADGFEGAIRPGHFDGVATVVAKLFGMVRPSDAYFGLKDYQQCRVIASMVKDLFIPVSLHFRDTVRESNGLAMSSRNAYLLGEERDKAAEIYRTLVFVKDHICSGKEIQQAVEEGKARLTGFGFDVQYLAAVNNHMRAIEKSEPDSRLVVAAKLGSVRLIDNIALL